MAPNANQVFRKWKNKPDIVYRVNKGIRQQLLPTRTYQQTKLQTQVPNTKCRMYDSQTETTSHILSGCSKIAQSLYKARHDRTLRPIYHHLLQKYYFQESNNKKPWYMQSIPTAVVENANAKILWNTPFKLESAPENGVNKIDIAVLDKQGKPWLLIEGTVCHVGRVKEKTSMKQEKYIALRKGIKNLYKDHTVTQINAVFDFLGVQGWRSGESTRLPPMWPGFDSQIRRHMWGEFVGSLLSTERFSPGIPVSPLLKNQHLT